MKNIELFEKKLIINLHKINGGASHQSFQVYTVTAPPVAVFEDQQQAQTIYTQ